MLRAYLFGPMRILKDEVSIDLPPSIPARSLLAYLLFNNGIPHARLTLAGTLWPEINESRARRRLSQALWNIRNTIPGLIDANRQIIRVDTSLIWVDVDHFREIIKIDATLDQAVSLYKNEFLTGFYDNWVILAREQLHESYLNTLEKLIKIQKSANCFEIALEYGHKLIEGDPLYEKAYREVMSLYLALDRHQEAIQQYEICKLKLERELGIQLSSETVKLAEEISQRVEQYSFAKTSQPDAFKPKEIPLIGREAERQILLDHIHRLCDGEGGLVLIEGEAGVGKTRLLQEIERDANWRGIQVLWGYGREMEVTSPFGPLVAALESGLTLLRLEQLSQTIDKPWLQVLKTLLPSFSSHLPELPPPFPMEPDQELPRLLEALYQLLVKWTRITPLIIILENLHWIDRDTLDLLPNLVRRISTEGILLLATYRGEEARTYPILWEKIQEMDRAGLRDRMIVKRLDAPATSELIHRYLDSKVEAPIFESQLFQETEGNPLFVLETLRYLQDEDLLKQNEAGAWNTPWDDTTKDYAELPLSPVVERVIANRLKRLHLETRSVLESAAVLGNRLEFSLLKSLCEQDSAGLLNALRILVRRQFLSESRHAYHFSHEKIRQVTYQSIKPIQRRQKHQKAGEILEKDDPDNLTSLAFHFFQGRVWDKAAYYSQISGEQAAVKFANQDALAHFNRALESLEQLPNNPPQKFAAHLAREKIYAHIGNRVEQAEELEILAGLAAEIGDAPLVRAKYQAEAALHQAQFAEATGDYDAGVAAAQAGIEFARLAGAVETEAASYLEWGVGLWRQGDHDSSRSALEKALELARAAGSDRLESESLRNLGNICLLLSDYSGANKFFDQTLAVCRQAGDLPEQGRTLNNLGFIAEKRGNNEAAKAYYEDALAICTQLGHRRDEGNTLNNLANIYLYQGDYLAAQAKYELALNIREAVGDQDGRMISLANLGIVYQLLGNYPLAQTYFERVLKLFQAVQNQWGAGFILAYLALCAHQTGDNPRALKLCQQAIQIADEIKSPDHLSQALLVKGHALLGVNRVDEATKIYEQTVKLRSEIDQPHLLAESLAGLARAWLAKNDRPQAQVQVDEILEHLQTGSVDGTEEPFRIYLTCIHVLQANNDPRARKVLTTAHQLLQEQAAKITDQDLQRAFLENVMAHREIIKEYKKFQGQKVTIRLPRRDAPTGRPLRDDEWVPVTWTITKPEDEEIAGKAPRRRQRLQRLLMEAETQGAAPTLKDLAVALNVSAVTIKRDLTALREAGIPVKTRGSRRNPAK